MNHKFQRPWWELELPPSWSAEDNEDCSSFYNEDGVGALQCSAYQKDEDITDSDLKEFAAEEIPPGAKLSAVQCGSFTGFYTHFDREDTYWRKWWLRSGQTMVYATYNCALSDRSIEDEQVGQILNSLRVRTKSA